MLAVIALVIAVMALAFSVGLAAILRYALNVVTKALCEPPRIHKGELDEHFEPEVELRNAAGLHAFIDSHGVLHNYEQPTRARTESFGSVADVIDLASRRADEQ